VIEFQTKNEREALTGAMELAKDRLRGLVERYPDFYPMYTMQGRWKHSGEAWTHWCDGFLPGMLWIVYGRESQSSSERGWWRQQAIRYSKPLEPRKHDREVHDLGFIFMSTYYRWFRLTQDPQLKAAVMEAGTTLAMRFQSKGAYLSSFMSRESVFIDIMMNVGIIFYTAIERNDSVLMDIAMRHTLTSRRVLVRGDGSTAHEGLFDPDTGEFLKQSTQQGFRGDSCWSRGLAWALYGFGTCYSYTRDPRFLQTAEACADYYIEHTPANGVPPWDYDAPEESRRQVDTSAAAIAAAGLFRLGGLCSDPVKGLLYDSTARLIVNSLCANYLSRSDPEWEGILKGGVYHIHKKLGVNESVMWGEYFFLEALDTALGA
jgi:unsaturated chondroitin disaccharide hydrolase